MFDWQNLGVSSIKFDDRTQLKSIERLEFDRVRLPNVRSLHALYPLLFRATCGKPQGDAVEWD